MVELKDASNVVIETMDEFQEYLYSLRRDSEAAYTLCHDFYNQVRKAEYQIKVINNEKITNKYAESIDRFYALLNDAIKTLNTAPIDVDHVNECISELKQISDTNFADGGLIQQDFNVMGLAETTINIINVDRHKYRDIDSVALTSEQLFNSGEFEESYKISGDLVKKLHTYREEEKRNGSR